MKTTDNRNTPNSPYHLVTAKKVSLKNINHIILVGKPNTGKTYILRNILHSVLKNELNKAKTSEIAQAMGTFTINSIEYSQHTWYNVDIGPRRNEIITHIGNPFSILINMVDEGFLKRLSTKKEDNNTYRNLLLVDEWTGTLDYLRLAEKMGFDTITATSEYSFDDLMEYIFHEKLYRNENILIVDVQGKEIADEFLNIYYDHYEKNTF